MPVACTCMCLLELHHLCPVPQDTGQQQPTEQVWTFWTPLACTCMRLPDGCASDAAMVGAPLDMLWGKLPHGWMLAGCFLAGGQAPSFPLVAHKLHTKASYMSFPKRHPSDVHMQMDWLALR